MSHQAKGKSSTVISRSHGFSERHNSRPPRMRGKPRAICRNFIYWGHCEERNCFRVHVCYSDMIDLFEYLLERDDCPPELRSIRKRFTPAIPGKSRRRLLSDRICPDYLEPDGCIQGENCPYTHLSCGQLYDSLLHVKPVGHQKVIDPTTMVVPVLVADEQPVVRLPGTTDYPPPPTSVDNDIVVRLPCCVESAPAPSACPDTDIPLHPSPTTDSPPVQQPRQIRVRGVCFNWVHGKCTRRYCKFLHRRDAVAIPQSPPTEPPLDPPPAQTNARHVPLQDQKVPSESPSKPMVDPAATTASAMTAVECDPAVIVACAENGLLHTIVSSPPHSQHHPAPVIPTEKGLSHAIAPSPPHSQHHPAPVIPEKGLSHIIALSPPHSQHHPAPVIPTEKGLSHTIALSPHSQQNPALVIPIGQEQPPQLQPQPPGYTSWDEITHSVMESTHVKFSGGFSIETIVTGFESRWFLIGDVPLTVHRADIESLVAPFGKVQDVRFRDDGQGDDCDYDIQSVYVRMANYRETVRAINELDGKQAFGRRITVQLSLAKTRMLRDNFIKVSWPIPCKAGYAGYSTLAAAQSAVSKADGNLEKGYWITATIYQRIPVIDAYNVRFMGLPHWVDHDFLNKFGQSEGTMLDRPNHQAQEFGVPAVRKTLANFGKIVKFHANPPPYKDGFVRAWCQFESPDVAAAACELHRVKQRLLGMEKISVRRVLSVMEYVPRANYDLIKEDLFHLQEEVSTHTHGAYLDFIPRPDKEKVPVRLVAEDSKTLARLRVEFKEIVDGELLKENGQQIWDDFLRRDAGAHFIEQLRGQNPGVMILVHSVRRCVRLIGTIERRQPVAAAIITKLTSLRQHKVHIIPLDGQAMGVLASPDFAAAQHRHGDNIQFDFQGHVLRVRGPDDVYEEIQQIVHAIKSRHVAGSAADNCPVCLEPPMIPVSLSCGHKWCRACLVSYLTAAADTRSFPISCLGNEGRCTKLIAMRIARNILSPADFEALALAAFHAYVQSHPKEYHYCPTPDCPQAYPNGPRNVPFCCPSCLARICPSCHVEYHEGFTCSDREDGGDRLFQEWMRTHGVKKCPGCEAPIQRTAGCNHMTCTRCHTHTCWECLETFPKGQGIYDHMRENHGGIGL